MLALRNLHSSRLLSRRILLNLENQRYKGSTPINVGILFVPQQVSKIFNGFLFLEQVF